MMRITDAAAGAHLPVAAEPFSLPRSDIAVVRESC